MNLPIDVLYKILNDMPHKEGLDRVDMYNGDHPLEGGTRRDGTAKHIVPSNFVKFSVDQILGFTLTTPIKYEVREREEIWADYLDLLNINNVKTIDFENYKQSLITGRSLELITYDGKDIRIKEYDPNSWTLLYDVDKNIQTAIYKYMIPKNTWVDGKLIQTDLFKVVVYEKETISYFEYTTIQNIQQIKEEVNYAGIVPIAEYSVQKQKNSIIRGDIIKQQKQYNEIYNLYQDDMVYMIDSLLLFFGFRDGDLTGDNKRTNKNDPTRESNGNKDALSKIQLMKQMGVLTVSDAQARVEFLQRTIDHKKFLDDLQLIKQNLYMGFGVLDIESLVNNNSVSGIALKIKFMTLIHSIAEYTKYFELGLNQRFDIINAYRSFLGQPVIDTMDINYKWTLNLPVSEIEIYNNIPNLKELFADIDIMAMLPNIENPEEYLKRKEEQKEVEKEDMMEDEDLLKEIVSKKEEFNNKKKNKKQIDTSI